jgi:hypothetical protein
MRVKTPVIDLGQNLRNVACYAKKPFFIRVSFSLPDVRRDGMQPVLLAIFGCFLPSILMVAWLVWQAHGRGEQAS